jgi:hypothetical protein
MKKLRETPFCPLFYRCKDGSILFPTKGIGRYYRGEVLQAFDWVRRMRTESEQLEAMKTNCPSAKIDEQTGLVYSFHYIKEYYDQRAKYPKSDARNKYLKLGVNAAWGKTAQSVGGQHGMPPGTANPWVAGVVTSETRAQVMDAMLNAPWNIIHAATDGIQSDAPLGIEKYDEKGNKGVRHVAIGSAYAGRLRQARNLCFQERKGTHRGRGKWFGKARA